MAGLLDAPIERDPKYEYGNILPYRIGPNGVEWGLTYSNAVKGLLDAFSLPGRALQGQEVTPEEAVNFALTFTGGGVGMPRPRGSLGMAGRPSKAENIAAGLYHPIGAGNKLPKPPGEMTSKMTPVAVPKPKTITPENLVGGKLVPAVGDRSRVGGLLTEVDGTPLANPVLMEGGEGFMRTHAGEKSAWASDKPVISGLAKMTAEAGKDGSPVYMVYSPMGQTAVDYSTMLTDALVQQLPNRKITKKAAKVFDDEVRKLHPDFVGVNDPRLMDQLRNSGPMRLTFAKRMDLADMQKLGFPNVAATRLAITEPKLLDLPSHASGSSVALLDPTGRVITDPAKPHTTYRTQLGGEYIGGLDTPIPRDIMFPTWAQGRRAAGKDPFGDRRAFEMNTPTRVQNADQQWLDGVMGYLEMVKKGLLD